MSLTGLQVDTSFNDDRPHLQFATLRMRRGKTRTLDDEGFVAGTKNASYCVALPKVRQESG